jgi:hypothetical protein
LSLYLFFLPYFITAQAASAVLGARWLIFVDVRRNEPLIGNDMRFPSSETLGFDLDKRLDAPKPLFRCIIAPHHDENIALRRPYGWGFCASQRPMVSVSKSGSSANCKWRNQYGRAHASAG